VLALVAIAIAARGRLPEGARFVVPALCLGLVVTIWNRLRFALVERGRKPSNSMDFDDNNRSVGSLSRAY
jgi:hypothetical protein